MEKYTFIDRYFHSQRELLDIRHSEERDINTLFTYLNNLHSTADKLLELFNCSIKTAQNSKYSGLSETIFTMSATLTKFVSVSRSREMFSLAIRNTF